MSGPRAQTLDSLLRAAAERSPDHPAIVEEDRSWNYAALARRAGGVAQLLREHGVGRGDRVVIHGEKGAAATAAVFGALMAGAAYVPLDPTGPPLRNAAMIRDARPAAVVELGGRSTEVTPAAALLDAAGTRAVVAQLGDEKDFPWSDPPPATASADDLAYVLYTSGSTGQPKGVEITHMAAMAFVAWAIDEVDLRSSDRVAGVAPLHFDLSTFDVFGATAAGATMIPLSADALFFPRRIPRLIASRGISVWYSVPSLWVRVLTFGRPTRELLAPLRVVLLAGEPCPPRHLATLMRLAAPGTRFLNLYGPTETNVCTWHEVVTPPREDESIPIGRPLPQVAVSVVDAAGRPVADGEAGELWVAAPTLMRGYRNDPEKTARSIVATLPDRAAGPAYRTGDVVRRDKRGVLHFMGRQDDQVKRLGHRVELREIEMALSASPHVVEAAVLAVDDGDLGASRLVAHVVVRPGGSLDDARAAARERLPRHMLPTDFVQLNALPRTSTGKVDRRALRSGDAS